MKKIYSIQKIVAFMIIGIIWFTIGITNDWLSDNFFTRTLIEGDSLILNRIAVLIGMLVAVGVWFGLTFFVFGIIKLFERRKYLKQNK